MAMIFNNMMIKNVGTTAVETLQTNSSTRMTVVGLRLTNVYVSAVNATVELRDDTTTETVFVSRNLNINSNQSLNVLTDNERLILSPNNTLLIRSDTVSSLDCVISYASIT